MTSWFLLGLLLSADAAASTGGAFTPPRRLHRPFYGRSPYRASRILRYANLSDIEARQITAVVREVYPGAIVNISEVTTGCPCEDGPVCTAQAWALSHRTDRIRGLYLSRIDGDWMLGPLQSWWLAKVRLERRHRDAMRAAGGFDYALYQRHERERDALYEAFPHCDDAEPDDARPMVIPAPGK